MQQRAAPHLSHWSQSGLSLQKSWPDPSGNDVDEAVRDSDEGKRWCVTTSQLLARSEHHRLFRTNSLRASSAHFVPLQTLLFFPTATASIVYIPESGPCWFELETKVNRTDFAEGLLPQLVGGVEAASAHPAELPRNFCQPPFLWSLTRIRI